MINAKNYFMVACNALSLSFNNIINITRKICFQSVNYFVIVKNLHINCFKAKKHRNEKNIFYLA